METATVSTPENKFETFEAERPAQVLKIAHSDLELTSTRKVNFDHHLCEKIIGYKEMPGERTLRPNHVNYLINCMLRGTFHPEWVKLIVCEHGKETWRMNGQHTTLARLEMPKGWKDAGQVEVMTYEAKSMDAMRELYASIDRGAARTKSNVVASYLTGVDQFKDVNQSLVRLLGESMAFWLWEGTNEQRKHDGDEIAYLMQHNHKQIVNVVVGYCMETPRVWNTLWLRRTPVLAAMFETFSKVVQDSAIFWSAVKTGVGIDSMDDPRLRLRNALQDAKMVVSTTKARSASVDRETIYRWCINCFNAWRKGEQLKTVRATKERQRAK